MLTIIPDSYSRLYSVTQKIEGPIIYVSIEYNEDRISLFRDQLFDLNFHSLVKGFLVRNIDR